MTKRFRVWAATVASAAVLAAVAAPFGASAAQSGDAQKMQTAQSPDVRVDLNIPAQALDSALTAFADQAGLHLLFASQDVAERRTPGLSGTFAPEDALKRLLAGTGMTWRFTDAKTVVLEKPKTDGALTLDPITVETQRESAWGQVKGYVATRSATGTKTDTPIIETPQSISVISRDQMDARGARRLDDALRYSAGVNAATYWNGPTTDPVSVRGFSVTSLYDGLRAYNNGFDTVVEPYGVERIEVLRGPSAVLYGQSGPGGVINVITKRPTTTPLREVELHGGQFNRKQVGIDFSDALDEKKTLLYRITALGRDADTQVDYIDDDRVYIAPAFTWKPTQDTDLTILTHYQRDRSAFAVFLPISGTLRTNPNGEIPFDRFMGEPDFDRNDKDTYSIGYDFNHRFNDVFSFRQNTRYFYSDVDRREISPLVLQGDSKTVTRRAEYRPQKSDIISIDNNLKAKASAGIVDMTFLAGLDFLDTDFKNQRWRGTAANLDIFNPVYGGAVTTANLIGNTNQHQSQIGTYAQGQFKLDKHWVVTMGGRYDWARLKSVNRLTDSETDQRDEAFTGRAGLVYLFDSGFAPYFSYSESFDPVIGTDAQSQPFAPETGTQYEVGVKYQPPGFNSFITLSAFSAKRKNVTTSDPDNPGFSIQTGEVTSKGIELEGVAGLARGLDLIGSYTYVDAEVTQSNGTDLGQRPAYEPRNLASLWADYTQPDGPAKGLGIGAGVRYVGTTYSSDGTIKMPSFTLADAALHYTWNDLKLALNVTNLFDRQYFTRCFSTACYTGEVRTVRLTARYRW
ncbi:MAG: TonB-dependent siderophore receptor [Rhodospirillales bacterium]